MCMEKGTSCQIFVLTHDLLLINGLRMCREGSEETVQMQSNYYK